MKILTKTIFLSLAMVLTVFSASAQKKAKVSTEEKVKTETDGIVAALGLDATQATALYDVNLEFAEKAKAYRKDLKVKKKAGNEVSKEDRKAANREMNKAKSAAQRKAIGKENVEALKAYQKKLRAEKKAARADKKNK